MAVITWTRDAKCKDCEHIRYYYEGKRKYHKCLKQDTRITLSDRICKEYEFRKEFYPKKLTPDV